MLACAVWVVGRGTLNDTIEAYELFQFPRNHEINLPLSLVGFAVKIRRYCNETFKVKWVLCCYIEKRLIGQQWNDLVCGNAALMACWWSHFNRFSLQSKSKHHQMKFKVCECENEIKYLSCQTTFHRIKYHPVWGKVRHSNNFDWNWNNYCTI